ncbi:sialate O-acetylesterase [Micromonospora noduli]|uniref:sialate O-acetylesterase n=1 Tax=Micromonospora noduli TaxID=709876 RepID=UPI000DBFB15B|nr:sialate O-acetylesterase [Micromonospora noduli]RAO14529.1 hypothetical protein GUI43_02225 [Micromonospora noduli]
MSRPHPPWARLQSVPRPAWIGFGVVVLLLAAVPVFGWSPSKSGAPDAAWSAADADAPPPAAPIDGTACAANAHGMAGFTPVSALDLPERNDPKRPMALSFDRAGAVAGGFDRIGYCLELTGPTGTQWVWTAMSPFTADARRLGLPTRAGQIVRQRIADLEVATNAPGLATGTGLTGYLEMWPNKYGPASSGQIPGAATDRYDADDDVYSPIGYGSFQVHAVAATRPAPAAPQTVLAVNGFTSDDQPLSVGIGTAVTGQPDWTAAGNAGTYTQRRLTVYARASVLTVSQHPRDRQLYPRDAAGGAVVPVAGKATDPRVRAVRLKVVSGADGWDETVPVGAGGEFAFRQRITAALREYRFELHVLGDGVARRAALWEGVVSGDVYVIQGQSNAVAASHQGSSIGEESPYVRSFGSTTGDRVLSGADRTWNYAVSGTVRQPGSVGQWGIRAAHRLMDTYQVPVAVINGAESSKVVSFFQRNDRSPGDLRTNYGRLRQRLTAANVIGEVRAVFWYQGEADNNDAAGHVAGFTALLTDWRREVGFRVDGGTRYYVVQVGSSPCGNTSGGPLREAQRRMADTLKVTVLSTTALSGREGCHFAWEQGYRELGDQAFAVAARDIHRGPSEGVAAPNPRSAAFTDARRTEVIVLLRNPDPLTVQAGAGTDFTIDGSTATVTGVEYREGGRLVLSLSGPADGAARLSYRGDAGPWCVNATGAGLLAFQGLPIAGG